MLLVPPLKFLFHPRCTIVHELGHTAVAWLFGFTAIPAFDFQYGGGDWMDFSRLAIDYFRTGVSTVAWGFLLCCALPPAAAFLYFRHKDRLAAACVEWVNR